MSAKPEAVKQLIEDSNLQFSVTALSHLYYFYSS